jgi:NAD+ synthase
MTADQTSSLRIALAQLDPTVGDLAGNAALARKTRAEAAAMGADLIVFSELFITGYPPEDLIQKPAFVAAARETIETLARETGDGGPAMLIGTPWPGEDKPYNSVALLDRGAVADVRHKVDLPNYGVFDEKRIFASGAMPGPVNFRDIRLGAPICEDIWSEDICECLAETGAELLLVPNGSPFTVNKHEIRMTHSVGRVTETGLPLAYVNQVGGQDELVFDGGSFVLNPGGRLAVQMPAWREAVRLTHWTRSADGWRCEPGELAVLEEGDGAIYRACVLGLRDYVEKTGFPGVVLGLSGGIDSALTAALAVDAHGADRVHCVMMPYRYTSNDTLSDAAACAEALNLR